MKTLETIEDVRTFLAPRRAGAGLIGLVPTMGALHEGHFSLLRAARTDSETVVASIFVNPTQFGPGEDYERYPRPLEADLAACRRENVDAVFVPQVQTMYPPGSVTQVMVTQLDAGFCGPHRPGHFEGVTTILAKLFNIIGPDAAYFGQKDYQQAVIVRRMVRDLNFPIRIVVCPTVREPDGLALSSRNAYLTPEQRRQARSLSAVLLWAREQVANGQRDAGELIAAMRERIEAAGPCTIDYIEAADAQDLTPKTRIEGRCVLALAVRIGSTRLIDNVLVDAPERPE